MARLLPAWLLLLIVSVAAASYVPPVPDVPPQFTSPCNLEMAGSMDMVLDGTFYNDAPDEIWRLDSDMAYIPGYPVDFVILIHSNQSYYLSQGVCRPATGAYSDLFNLFSSSDYAGQVTVNGTLCNQWTLYVPNFFNYTLDVLADDNTRPVILYIGFPEYDFEETFTFPIDGEFVPYVSPLKAIIPKRCGGDGTICPTSLSEGIQTMQMVRFHSNDDYTLTNKNTADFQGDASFLCTGISGNETKNSVISLYNVTVNTQWGQYALCNYDNCQGGNDYSVGHEGAYGVPMFGGQCSNNTEYGNWYSLREGAECTDGHYVGDGSSCAWQTQALVKSISLDCLLSLGYFQACEKDGMTFPFADSTAVLQQAFDYDEADGGCPDLSGWYYGGGEGVSHSYPLQSGASLVAQHIMDTMQLLHATLHSR